MKVAKLLHNPGAGNEEYSEKELQRMLEDNGYECRYSSTKKSEWKEIELDTDLLVVGGGDGTVRKITKELLDRKMFEKTWPIVLLPLGTANNIARTIGQHGSPEEIINGLSNAQLRHFDIGIIENINNHNFFLESFGFGIFPYLMQVLKKKNDESDMEPEEKILNALSTLYDLILEYQPRKCYLEIDGLDHSGNYILAEVMNTRSFGPNLMLAPDADPADGYLEVVTVSALEKSKFAAYVQQKIQGREAPYTFNKIKGKQIKISWEGSHVHVDDEIVKINKSTGVMLGIRKGLIEFLVNPT